MCLESSKSPSPEPHSLRPVAWRRAVPSLFLMPTAPFLLLFVLVLTPPPLLPLSRDLIPGLRVLELERTRQDIL